MQVITSILASIGEVLTSVFGVVADVFEGVLTIFYTPGAEGVAGSLTFLGEVIAFTMGATLAGIGIYVVIKLLKSAIGRIGSGVRNTRA